MKVLIADKFEQSGVDQLQQLGCQVIYRPGTQGLALEKAVADTECNVLIVRSTKVPRATIEASPELKLIIRAGSGFDTIDVKAASENGVHVCNSPGSNAVAVAELVIGMMIALDRRLVDETDDLRRRVWNKKEYSRSRGLKGRTLGIIGLGRVGVEVSRRAAAFDMRILYYDIEDRTHAAHCVDACKASLEQLLTESDYVTLHVPGGKDTQHMIGTEELAMMKPTAFLINTCRGGVLDECALADALEDNRLAGAALDVFEIEPTSDEHEFKDPILTLPLVYGTHHVGASTEQAQRAVAEGVVQIVRVYFHTGECLHCVNPPQAVAL